MKDILISGAIGAAISLMATYIIHLVVIPSEHISWALIAVTIAGFFASIGGYLGARRS